MSSVLHSCHRCWHKFEKLESDTMCKSCCTKLRIKQSVRLKKAKEDGLCTTCLKRKPVANINTCQQCRDYSKKRTKLNRQKGLCGNCSKPSVKPEIYLCEVCWFKLCAYNNLGTRNMWNEIRDIFEQQNSRCAITGQRLYIGENASLDHIIPKSKGGSNLINNLQWTTRDVNHMKHTMTNEELIVLCKQILKHQGEL